MSPGGGGFLRSVLRFRHSRGGDLKGGWTFRINPVGMECLKTRKHLFFWGHLVTLSFLNFNSEL
jgi:hypothetical protein